MTREEMYEKQTILIIDDDESNRRSLALILEARGYETETAETGAAALEKAQGRFFNLALVDIKLPDIEGIELITPLKEIHPDIAVIMVTGFGSMETAVRSLKEGALGYITKPFNMEEMLATINQTLDKQRLVIENRKLYNEAQRELAERRRLQGALRESEKKYRDLIEDLPDIIYAVDLNGVLTYVSPAVESMVGYRPSEVLGRPFTDFTYQKDLPHTIKYFRSFLSGHTTTTAENRVMTKSGEVRWMLTSARPISKGNRVIGVQGVMTDITHQKQIESMLRESEEKLRVTFDSIAEGILVTDLGGKILEMNDSAVRISGYANKEEVIGRPGFEFITEKDIARASEDATKTLETGDSGEIQYTLLAKDGRELPVEMRAAVLKDRSGNPAAFVYIMRDISERKRAQEEQRQMQEELNLASRLASVGELASGVAHEINNPLSAVIGFSELLMRRDVSDETKQDLQIINESAQRVARIVKNLLVFARRSKSGREYADINSILSAGLELRAYEMHNNNIELVTWLDPRLPWTVVDVGRIQQVFLNIIINAEQAMRSARGEGRLLVTTKLIDGSIRVSFEDNGPGISPENLNMVFDPFFTTKAVGEGTGLGLSISYGIMKEHDGKISVQSKPGKGATFTVELPLVAETQQSEPPASSGDEQERTTGAKVMVVDDEAGVREIIDRALTAEGHSVDAVDNASAALERLKHEPYHLVLLDIRMPGMDGVEFYGHLKKIAPSLTRRVLFMTGDSMSPGTEDFLSKTRVPFMRKPFGIDELQSNVDHILSGRAKPGGVRPRTCAGVPVDQVRRR